MSESQLSAINIHDNQPILYGKDVISLLCTCELILTFVILRSFA